MKMHSSIRRVLGQEVEPQTRQNLVAVLVLPQQLQLADADDVRIVPDLDEEKLSERKDFRLAGFVQVLGRLVEGVGGVVAAGGPHELEEATRARTLLRVHS